MPALSDDPDPTKRGATFPVAGIGASAGGLEALRQLLHALPVDTGMGFVIVQHLSPEHASSLAEILARSTAMPVCEVRDEPAVEPNRVYVIPPGRDMIIEAGKLRLLPQERAARHRGIDQFFRSLAEDSAHLAIGIVLSAFHPSAQGCRAFEAPLGAIQKRDNPEGVTSVRVPSNP